MARPLRVEYPGAYYHVINLGNAGEDIFHSIRDREKFLEYLEKTVERFSIVVHTYKDPDHDIEITYTGLRPGEKLHEELISEGEGVVATNHNKILVLRTSQQYNGMEDQATFCKWLMKNIEELYKFAYEHDTRGIKEKLKDIVPEYEVQDSECVF